MTQYENKAHTATANRIAQLYGTTYNAGNGFDIQTEEMTIEVETTASLPDAIRRLEQQTGRVYVALTNKDGVRMALKMVENTRIGVMDPQGQIVRESVDGQTTQA